jgi:hypothetical protein
MLFGEVSGPEQLTSDPDRIRETAPHEKLEAWHLCQADLGRHGQLCEHLYRYRSRYRFEMMENDHGQCA